MVKAPDSKSGGKLSLGGSNPSVVDNYNNKYNNIYIIAWMAEWSKAVDLSSILFVGVGSNPTSGNTC